MTRQQQNDRRWMALALEEAALALPDDVPVGAIILRDGEVIARAHNRRERDHNPIAHAEILALQSAGGVTGDWRLSGCTLYVTLEPCPMCASAIAQSRVSRVIFGAYDPLAGACGSKHALLMPSNGVEITGGILEMECRGALGDFFSARR